ncbi:MAG: replicative DNA helicase [Candidatus Vogelbacteria bacterium]|nr:replicative DNA helicase [Candidatus Vogelbacteria bacterium]
MRLPPQDIDAERALLGSVMLSPRMVHDIIDIVGPDSFYAEKHRMIYAAMFDLFSRGEPIDLISLSNRLREKKQLDQIGGSSYLSELTATIPTASNIGYYAELIRKKHLKRNLIEAAEHISTLGYDGNDDIEELIDKAEKRVFDLGNIGSSSKFIGIKTTLADAWERLDTLNHATDEIRGVTTGFADLDHKLAGLQKSDLVILAARPSMGKTSLALDIARNAGRSGRAVGIFSLEMSAQQLVDRLLAMESRVDAWKLRTGKLSSDEEFGLIRDALDKLSQTPIYIDDDSSNNIIRMRSVARRLKREYGLDLIIVDYLQLMTPTRHIESMVQQVTEISRALKGLARELDVPVLALSQLSRAVEARGGEPRLSDLRDSGSIEQDADVVMFIHRDKNKDSDENTSSNVAKVIIAKHRNGPTGSIDLVFDDKHVTFMTIEKSDLSSF